MSNLATSSNVAPRILVEAHTDGLTLSKSDGRPFTITLRAVVDSHNPVTIDTFMTVLLPRAAALDYQGLGFKDAESGKLAKRRVIDVQYRLADNLTAKSDSVVTIPPIGTEPYTVYHTLKIPDSDIAGAAKEVSSIDKALAEMSDQTVGLIPGHTYEIGLGTHMSSVSWWAKGSREDVFAHGPQHRRPKAERLRMELINTASFTVAE